MPRHAIYFWIRVLYFQAIRSGIHMPRPSNGNATVPGAREIPASRTSMKKCTKQNNLQGRSKQNPSHIFLPSLSLQKCQQKNSLKKLKLEISCATVCANQHKLFVWLNLDQGIRTKETCTHVLFPLEHDKNGTYLHHTSTNMFTGK